MPARDIPRLPSVTAAVILDLARADGIDVRQAHATPDELEGREVWLANALRGIRAVTRWHAGPRVAPAERAPAWRARLQALRRYPRWATPIRDRPDREPAVIDDAIDLLLETIGAIDPLLRTLLAGLAMLFETSVLLGLVVPGDTIVIITALAVEDVAVVARR